MKNLFKNLFGGKKVNKEIEALKEQNALLMQLLQNQGAVNTTVATAVEEVAPTSLLDTIVKPVQNVVNTNIVTNTTRESDVEADNYEHSVNRNNFEGRRFSSNLDNMPWKDISNEDKNCIVDEIREVIFGCKNPTQYAEAIADFRNEALQHYYMLKLLSRGQYNPEVDNLEALDKKYLIKAIAELEEEQFVEFLTNKGSKILASDKQIELLKKNGVDTSNIKYWWTASVELENIFGEYDSTPSDKQVTKITELVSKLGLQGYDMSVATKKEASDKINELMTMHDEKFGAEKPTQEQVDLVKRYLKLNNMRLTKSVKEKIVVMSKRELSEYINELRAKYNAEHPECSEGQANYIISLCNQLMIPCNPSDVKDMLKDEATNKIDELSRELLYRKMRRTMVSITMQEIKALTKEEVKSKLDEFRKTN